MYKGKVAMLFGDKRQELIRKFFRKKGFEAVHIKSREALREIDGSFLVVFPLPMTKDGKSIFFNEGEGVAFSEVYSHINEKQTVICASPSPEVSEGLKAKTERLYDLMKDETFIYYNACLTAQGALRLLLENTDEYLSGKRCLIIGFGRVGETLAKALHGLEVETYVCARNQLQIVKAEAMGCKTLSYEEMRNCIYLFDFIFGTVPHNVLTSPAISLIGERTIYFELASPPFTAQKELFTLHEKKHIMASALPGKYVTKSAAEFMGERILSYIG